MVVADERSTKLKNCFHDHPDYELLNRDGSTRKVSWWNSLYLCPADRNVVEYHKALRCGKDFGGLGI